MEDRRPEVLVVSIVFFLLASIFVALRFVSRIFIVRRLSLGDYLMLLAWVIDFGFSFALFYATSKGLGLHDNDIAVEARAPLSRANYAFTVLYNPALMAVKSAILVFYLTLTQGEKLFRYANYATLLVVNLAGFALTFVNIFQCRPVSAAWAASLPVDAHCTDILTLYLSSSPVNIITDLAILVLPNPILTRMRLPLKQKIILVVTFSFGFFVAVVDVIRIAYLQEATTDREIALRQIHLQNYGGGDFAWYASLSFMWSVVEVNVSIMCACVPSLKPLVARIVPKMIRDNTNSTQTSPSDPPPLQPMATADAVLNESVNPMSLSEALAIPGPINTQTQTDTEANTTTLTSTSDPRSMTFFDFVNMKKPANMLKLSNKESIAPNAITTVLFFLWGFAYGFLDILNDQFKQIVRLDAWRSLGLHCVYFGGYLVAPPLVGRLVLKRWGFKATFITGLCFYACGSLIFWPSAVLTSYSAFLVSNFITGCGLAILETAANPFISLCGPLENSEVRLNISQGVQAVGSVLSPLLAKRVLFRSVTDVSSLVDVQWTYLGISLFDVLLALAFYYLPIPEASDEDLEELANRRRDDNRAAPFGIPVVWMTLALGIWSQFFYVAGQEVFSTSFDSIIASTYPDPPLNSFTYLTIGRSIFAVGRFLAAFLQWFLKPRWILLLSYIGMIVFAALSMHTTGPTAIASAMLVYLFESGAFSIIFAIALRGTGKHTKTAGTLLTIAISGGAFLPFARFAAQLATNSTPDSYAVLVALFAAGALFPVYLNVVPAARKQVDPVPNEHLRHTRRRRSRVPKTSANVHALPRQKDNPSQGGVYSRRRSVLDDPDPLPSMDFSGPNSALSRSRADSHSAESESHGDAASDGQDDSQSDCTGLSHVTVDVHRTHTKDISDTSDEISPI
ncbi:putative MFS monosaccharide transporter [Aspergillus undulatus]|uniref:putative MFS monosaccharide transporter n=1 Tax=Aspergillus undulatus TaxID=1810928 RepID=UPI003CCD609D